MKIKKSLLFSVSTAALVTPMAAALVVSCGSSESVDVGTSIIYYYDQSNYETGGIKEAVDIYTREYNTRMEQAYADGTIKNKVNLIARPGETAYWAKDQMVATWGYNNSKSPDLWLGAATDTESFTSKSGNTVVHQFEEDEYQEFWDAAGFSDTDDAKTPEFQGISDKSGKTVRQSLPYFNKGFFYIRHSEDEAVYDGTLNGKLASGATKLSSSNFSDYNTNDLDIKETLVGMSNSWNHNPFSTAIFDYLRGDESAAHGGHGRRNSNGYSNTTSDLVYIPQITDPSLIDADGKLLAGSDVKLESILFADANGSAPAALTTAAGGYNLSETAIAWMQMIQDANDNTEYNDSQGNSTRSVQQDGLGSMGFATVPEVFRKTQSDTTGSAASLDVQTVLGFMGASKSKAGVSTTESQVEGTANNDHKYKHLLGAGIDWAKFMKTQLTDGRLSAAKLSDDAVEDELKHYSIYRAPLQWQMDDTTVDGFNLMTEDSVVTATKKVTELDGRTISGIADKVSTVKNITPQADGDYMSFNERLWEMPAGDKRDSKMEAMKIFLDVLYDESIDGYAEVLLQDQGTFSGKKALLDEGKPSLNADGTFKSQADRLWTETINAVAALNPADQDNAAVGSDANGNWHGTYWGNWGKMEENSGFTAYGWAKQLADSFAGDMAKNYTTPETWGEPKDNF